MAVCFRDTNSDGVCDNKRDGDGEGVKLCIRVQVGVDNVNGKRSGQLYGLGNKPRNRDKRRDVLCQGDSVNGDDNDGVADIDEHCDRKCDGIADGQRDGECVGQRDKFRYRQRDGLGDGDSVQLFVRDRVSDDIRFADFDDHRDGKYDWIRHGQRDSLRYGNDLELCIRV